MRKERGAVPAALTLREDGELSANSCGRSSQHMARTVLSGLNLPTGFKTGRVCVCVCVYAL